MESVTDSIKYYYGFDDPIDLTKASSSNPLKIKILGQPVSIISIDSASKFTAVLSSEYTRYIDNGIRVYGKVIKLIDVGSDGSIIVDVSGVQDVISPYVTKRINGLDIANKKSFYDSDKTKRYAILTISFTQNYQDGDSYIGEDQDDPSWVWDIGNLNTVGSTSLSNSVTAEINASNSGPFIGVESDWNYRDGSDAPAIEIGECINLPNKYVGICLDGIYPELTAQDVVNGMTTFELQEGIDLTSDSRVPGFETASAIIIKKSVSDIKLLKSSLTNLTFDKFVNTIYIVDSDNIFYRDPSNYNKITYAGGIYGTTASKTFAQFNSNTEPINLSIGDYSNFIDLHLQDLDSKSLVSRWYKTNGKINSLGQSKSWEEAEELQYCTYTLSNNFGGVGCINIGTKDENHRSKYGIIIYDPKSNGASDRVSLSIPSTQVRAVVSVK